MFFNNPDKKREDDMLRAHGLDPEVDTPEEYSKELRVKADIAKYSRTGETTPDVIRNTTFSRVKNGYEPSMVDDVLDYLAISIESGDLTQDMLKKIEFRHSDNGYDPDEVDAFITKLEKDY